MTVEEFSINLFLPHYFFSFFPQSQRSTLTLQPQQNPLSGSLYNTMMIPQQSPANMVQISTSLAQNTGPSNTAVATFAQDRSAQIRCFFRAQSSRSCLVAVVTAKERHSDPVSHLTGFLQLLSCWLSWSQDRSQWGRSWSPHPCSWVRWWRPSLPSRARLRPSAFLSSRSSSSRFRCRTRFQRCRQVRLLWPCSSHSFCRYTVQHHWNHWQLHFQRLISHFSLDDISKGLYLYFCFKLSHRLFVSEIETNYSYPQNVVHI